MRKKTRVLGPFKAADRFGSGFRELERARAVAAPPYMRTYVQLQRPWGHTKPVHLGLAGGHSQQFVSLCF